MFLRAGFNPRHREIARAASGIDVQQLIRFEPSGELAWYRPGVFLRWTPYGLRNLIDDGLDFCERLSLPKSELRK